ncbi:predicted protein [Botrytis cinerea T4]|uniref:Uncharacterized protein n=1 Tax=Botryotinia fuckeliana (strain T4) TaxID=999810 RepID=G2XS83_BOTF4|nr:predicted protein [Botrytis cinerea T4]
MKYSKTRWSLVETQTDFQSEMRFCVRNSQGVLSHVSHLIPKPLVCIAHNEQGEFQDSNPDPTTIVVSSLDGNFTASLRIASCGKRYQRPCDEDLNPEVNKYVLVSLFQARFPLASTKHPSWVTSAQR